MLLIFWAKNNHDIANATPEELQEIKEGYLEKYHTAKPLERPDALELLGVYGEHFFKTATTEERAAFAIAIGRTPLEYEIMGEGFSKCVPRRSWGKTRASLIWALAQPSGASPPP